MVSTGVGQFFEFLKWFRLFENPSLADLDISPQIYFFVLYFDFESSLQNQLSHKMDSCMQLFFSLKNPVMGWKTPQRRCLPQKRFSKRLNISKWVLWQKLKNYLI